MVCPNTTPETLGLVTSAVPPRLKPREEWERDLFYSWTTHIWNRCCELEHVTAWYHHRGRSAPETVYDELAVRERQYREAVQDPDG